MITKNPMQLKAFIKNKAAEKHISAQLVMQNYMLERLLERISLSPYKNNFILKGGFLISAIVGLDTRATMDLDTTIKGFTLTYEAIRKIFTEICAVQIADDVQFEVVGISDIRETDDYPGIRVALKATGNSASTIFCWKTAEAKRRSISTSGTSISRWQILAILCGKFWKNTAGASARQPSGRRTEQRPASRSL